MSRDFYFIPHHIFLKFSMPMTKKLTTAAVGLDIRDNPEKLNTPLHWAVSFLNIDALHFFVGNSASLFVNNFNELPLLIVTIFYYSIF